MTTFALKLIALITMFIDHGSILLLQTASVSFYTYIFLRGIGRIAFPIYSFLLVKGFNYSSDKRKYLFRLMSFALISQIPFSLYFSHTAGASAGPAEFAFSGAALAIVGVLWLCAYIVCSKTRSIKELLVLLLFILLPGFRLNLGSICLLNGEMSIFYSLSLSLAAVYFIQTLREKALNTLQLVLSAAAILAAVLIIQPCADYGISALILILGLYFLNSRRLPQAVYMCVWAFLQYGFTGAGLMYSLFACLSAVLVFFYNGRKGPSAKYFFYAFYPVHLIILSIITFLVL